MPTSEFMSFALIQWNLSNISDRKGLNAKQAEFVVHKYRSHCRVGAGIMMSMEMLVN
jgi:hypothetical protein